MASSLTEQGPLVETLDENEAALTARFVDEFGPGIVLIDPDNYTKRELDIMARSFVEIQNLQVGVVEALSPDSAQGRYLDNGPGQLLRELRKGPTNSTISARLTGVPGTEVGDRRVRYRRNDSLWRTPQTLPNETDPLVISANGTVEVTLTATETGVVTAGQDGTTEWVIVDEVTGWDANSGTVESLADSIDGTAREEDPAYRDRLRLAGRSSGVATEPGVQRTLRRVVTSLRLLNNRENTPVDGVPGKHSEAIVEGGTDLDIANAIFDSYGGTDGFTGTTLVEVFDIFGNSHTVKFTRVQRVNLVITVIIDTTATDPSAPPLPDDARSITVGVVETRVNGLAEGVDVLPDDLEGQTRAAFLGGAIPENGVTVSIGLKGGAPPVNAPFIIGTRQRARTNPLAQAAEIIGTETQTFTFVVTWVLDIAVDGGNVQNITFTVGDFANTGAVTTLEIAAAIENGSTGLTAGSELGALVLRSDSVGQGSKLEILGTTSPSLLTELGLSVGDVLGSDGDISVVII